MTVQMTITPQEGAAYLLAQSPGRPQDGTPIGPDAMEYSVSKGVLDREPVGADGIVSEPCGCDRRTLTFGVSRHYATEALAVAAAASLEQACPPKGAVTIGSSTLIASATLRQLRLRVSGRRLSAVYSFEGY